MVGTASRPFSLYTHGQIFPRGTRSRFIYYAVDRLPLSDFLCEQDLNLQIFTHDSYLSLLRSPCLLSQTPKSLPSAQPSKHDDGGFHISHGVRHCLAL